MSDTVPLPEPAIRLHGKRGKQISPEAMDFYTADQMHSHVAAVSAADNAALRADNIRLQNEVVGPLRERVKVLEQAIQHYESALKARWPEGAMGESFGHWNSARAALEKP